METSRTAVTARITTQETFAQVSAYIYHQPTKLPEGNVFSLVCHYVRGEGVPRQGTALFSTSLWPQLQAVEDPALIHVQTCLTWTLLYRTLPPDMFKLFQLRPHCTRSLSSHPHIFLLVQHGPHCIGPGSPNHIQAYLL